MKKHKKKWVACSVEAEYFTDDRKIARFERKMASAKDRSKYKKTDQNKQKKQIELEHENLLRGRVVSIISQGLNVNHENKIYLCTLRGHLKKEISRLKNLVTVGDYVLFEKTADTEGVISHIEERHSTLSRADHLNQKKEQLIASNIDQVLITVSVVNPPLKPFLVDRYIIATRKGNMEPVIVINKIDLLEENPSEKELYEAFFQAWTQVGIPVAPVSATTNEGLDQLKELMKNKASVFSGQSGVGKSSLINAITSHTLTIGNIVEKTGKGSHTTTRAELLPLDFGGWVIDTPGIKSFGVWDLQRDEVEQYFSDIYAFGAECKFLDCSHLKETGCAVIDAVERGEIPRMRYESYLYLMESLREEHRRR